MARPGGGGQVDLTVYSTPVVTTIDGQRVLVAGNGNGGIFAFKVATGEKVWGFSFSRRGINTSPVVADNRVYVTHSEENVDTNALGSRCMSGCAHGQRNLAPRRHERGLCFASGSRGARLCDR